MRTARGGLPRVTVRQILLSLKHALLHLRNPYILAESRLCPLSCVQAAVEGHGQLAGSYALQKVLLWALEAEIEKLVGPGDIAKLRIVLEGVRDGKTIADIAKYDLHLWRETVQKNWWPRAAMLIAR